ncbi:MAG: BRO family protein [Erysipelotrichaceae bacterium]
MDVVRVLTKSKNPRRYWSDLKSKMKDEEGAYELYDFIVQLKLKAPDGKMRLTDVSNTQGILRIIQSIPSPKAEPFKMWLAEATTTEIKNVEYPYGLDENKETSKRGGTIAGNTRKAIEKEIRRHVITSKKEMNSSKLTMYDSKDKEEK